MVWKKTDGTIIQTGQMWIDDKRTKHPSISNYTESELKGLGLTWHNPTVPDSYDRRFYWSKDKPKNLDDVDAKDIDGNQVYESDGKTKVINKGLKSQWIETTKQTARNMLSQTDWMVTRKTEKGTEIPTDTTTLRDSIRTKCAEIETQINACSKMEDFIKLFDTPEKGGNPPIFDFPKGS